MTEGKALVWIILIKQTLRDIYSQLFIFTSCLSLQCNHQGLKHRMIALPLQALCEEFQYSPSWSDLPLYSTLARQQLLIPYPAVSSGIPQGSRADSSLVPLLLLCASYRLRVNAFIMYKNTK